jgi:Tfp pilus assembly protein PilF
MNKESLLKLSKVQVMILALLTGATWQAAEARPNLKSSGESRIDSACAGCLNQAAALFAQKRSSQALELLLSLKDKCAGDKNFQLLLLTIAGQSPGKEELALEAAHRVLAQTPDSQPALLTAGLISLRQNNKVQAQQYFETLVKSDPTSFEAWSTLQDIYQATGENEKAKAASLKASLLEPASLRARLGLLANLNANGKRENLQSQLNQQLESESNQLCPEFYILLGNCALRYGFPEQAAKAFSRASQSYPQLGSLQRSLALSQIQAQELDEAEQSLKQLTNGSDKTLLESWLLFERNRADEAQTLLQSLKPDNDNKALTLFVQALVARQKGEDQQARSLFNQSLEADKAKEFALAKLELIKLDLKSGNLEEVIAQARSLATTHCGFKPQASLLEAQAAKSLANDK